MYSFSTKGIRSKRIHIEANGLRIPLLILKPLSEPENAPGVMWIHGGGYMTGMKEMAYIGRAAISMLARDKGEVKIAFQMPLYPMIDNFDTESSRDNHAKVWNTRRNHQAWAVYLRKDAKKEVSPYAAPSRQTDYSNLPPAYTFVCTAEPFYCETLKYIEDLKAAGVEAKVDVYEGMYHAFDMSEPEHPTGKEAIKNFNEMFAYAKEHYFAKQEG